MSQVVIIGAGISGLASAALLARDGHSVTVVEARQEIGGRAGSWTHGDFRFDTGPSWYLMPEVFDHFYKLMGTSAEEQLALVTLDPGYRVYFEGADEPLDISANRSENVELFERVEKGAGARLDRYLDAAAETYELAKEKFLYTTFEDVRPILSHLGHWPRLARLLLQPLSRLAARTVKDNRLRQILGYPAVFLGASPKLAPSMYHLMSHLDLSEGVLYPMGGFARVIESVAELATAAGATIVTGASVSRIVVEHGSATGVEYVDRDRKLHYVDADIVVSSADLHHTETKLLQPEEQTYPEEYWEAKVAGPGALLLCLGVRGELPQLEHHTLLFAKDWDRGFEAIFGENPSIPSPPSLYICKPSGVDPDVAPEGFENLLVLVPIPADPTIGRGDVDGDGDTRIEVLADQVIRQIAEWTGVQDLESRITVRRTVGPGNFADELNAWKGSALGPAHTLRQSAMFRAGNVSKKVKGLYYTGSSTIPGIGLPMCLISAELLVKRLRGDTSTTPLAEPLQNATAQADAAAVASADAEVASTEATVAARAARAARWGARTAAARDTAGRVAGTAAAAAKAARAAAANAAAAAREAAKARLMEAEAAGDEAAAAAEVEPPAEPPETDPVETLADSVEPIDNPPEPVADEATEPGATAEVPHHYWLEDDYEPDGDEKPREGTPYWLEETGGDKPEREPSEDEH